MNLYYESSNELYHHGIKGMKWGRRRFQNSDGSLTAAGRKRYTTVRQATKNAKQAEKDAVKTLNNSPKKHTLREYGNAARAASKQSVANDKAYNKQLREERKAERNTPEAKAARKEKAIKAAKVGAAVAGTALAVYGAKKVHDMVKEKNIELGHEKASKLFNDYYNSNVYSVDLLGDGKVSATSLNGRNSMVFDGDRNNAISTIGNLNAQARKTADDIMNKSLDEAYGANFRTAAKNVGSHYYNNTAGGQAVKSGVNAVKNAPGTARNAAKNVSETAKNAKKGVEEAARLQRMKNDPNYTEALLKKAARHNVYDLSLTGNNHDLAKQMTERGLDPFVIYRKKRK